MKDELKQALHEELLHDHVIKGCFNCDHHNPVKDQCDLFGIKPPIKVITFSCGKDWYPLLPF